MNIAAFYGKIYRASAPFYHRFKAAISHYPWLYAKLAKLRQTITIAYPESALAHRYLDGLQGIEIGASAFNGFGLNTINVNFTDRHDTVFHHAEQTLQGNSVRVDVAALGDCLPFADASWDFLIASHVIEHFHDPIAALYEWMRVVRPGGYVFLIVPHKERTFDRPKPRTSLQELITRHAQGVTNSISIEHQNIWITQDFLELCRYLRLEVVEYQDSDDKVGNGFAVVIRKA